MAVYFYRLIILFSHINSNNNYGSFYTLKMKHYLIFKDIIVSLHKKLKFYE